MDMNINSKHEDQHLDEDEHSDSDSSYLASPVLSSSDSLASEEPSTLGSDSEHGDDDTSLASPISPLTSMDGECDAENVAENFAFAFDIDGVLVRGGKAIPEAIEAMKVLNGENEYGIKV